MSAALRHLQIQLKTDKDDEDQAFTKNKPMRRLLILHMMDLIVLKMNGNRGKLIIKFFFFLLLVDFWQERKDCTS